MILFELFTKENILENLIFAMSDILSTAIYSIHRKYSINVHTEMPHTVSCRSYLRKFNIC